MKIIIHFVDGKEAAYIYHDYENEISFYENFVDNIRDEKVLFLERSINPGKYELVNLKYAIRIEKALEKIEDTDY